MFAFAGLWSRWGPREEALETCTIITTEANELCQHVHDRMPVILAPEDYLAVARYRRSGPSRFVAPVPVRCDARLSGIDPSQQSGK